MVVKFCGSQPLRFLLIPDWEALGVPLGYGDDTSLPVVHHTMGHGPIHRELVHVAAGLHQLVSGLASWISPPPTSAPLSHTQTWFVSQKADIFNS